MKKIILAITGLLAVTCAYAQERPAFAQYIANPYVINPAVAGAAGRWNVKAGMRYQWTGIEDAPRTYYLSAHGPVSGEGRRATQGIGTIITRDETGPISNTTFSVSYAYQAVLTETLKLSAGIGAGFNQFRIDVSELDFAGPDPVTSGGNNTEFSPALSLGLWLKSDRFFTGVSAYQSAQETTTGKRSDWYYYLTGGYIIQASDDIAIIPAAQVILKSTSQRTIEANARVKYKDAAWGGVSYRHDKAVTMMAGFSVAGRFDFGYSFDFSSGHASGPDRKGAHEFMLGARL